MLLKIYHQETENQNYFTIMSKNTSFELSEYLEKYRMKIISNSDFAMSKIWNKHRLEDELLKHDIHTYFISEDEFNNNQPLYKTKINHGKYSSYSWENVPTDYLKWATSNIDEQQRFYMLANAEMKRREFNPLYNFDKDTSRIEFGKHKGELWTNIPVDYLEWIKNTFDEDSIVYNTATMIVSWQDKENEYIVEVSMEAEQNKKPRKLR